MLCLEHFSVAAMFLGAVVIQYSISAVPVACETANSPGAALALTPDIDDRHQSITTPSQGLDVPRVVRGIHKAPASGLDRRIDALVEIDDHVIRPQPALDFFAGDNFALPFKDHPQNLKHLFSEENLLLGSGASN